jgi:uncharacterized membrane protein
MKITAQSGAALATAAAMLLLSGAVSAPSAVADEAKGKCIGANACKGQSACATGSNSCHATNACKGQGWLELGKAECEKIEGAKFEPASK